MNARTATGTEINGSLSWTYRFRVLIGWILVVLALLMPCYNEIGCVMRLISISGAAESSVSSANCFIEVALHVTKRPNGANAKTRGRVTGSINGNVTSQEERRGKAVG